MIEEVRSRSSSPVSIRSRKMRESKKESRSKEKSNARNRPAVEEGKVQQYTEYQRARLGELARANIGD